MKSNQAKVAKLCKEYITKKKGLKCRVRSEGFSMGDSVDVTIYDQPPNIRKEIEDYCSKYQYGHFDGMTDMYEYSNRQHDIPQTKYLHVHNDLSKELKQEALTFIRETMQGGEELPENYDDLSHERIFDEWATTVIYQFLSGYREGFWEQRKQPEPPKTQATTQQVKDMTISKGTREGFSEVRFPSIPDVETRDRLKANGFRWSRFNKCWYGKTEKLPVFDNTNYQEPREKKQPVKTNQAEKLRTLADKMQKQIDDKLADRLTNTPKRLAQANHAKLEGERLQRTQQALYGLADLYERTGSVPAVLQGFTSKKAIYDLMGTKKETVPNGYHTYYACTGEPSSETLEAKALWELLAPKTEEEKQVEETQRKIDGLQFSNIPGYFPTPESVIDKMLSFADLDDKQDILEPSAGHGAIIEKINQTGFNSGQRVAYEYNYTLSSIIKEKFPKWAIYSGDFLAECESDGFNKFDRIIMNPPFDKGVDIKHIKHAMSLLKEGGKLVALCANGPRQEKELQTFADHWEVLPEGSFKESGTGVSVALLVISN